MPSRRRFLQLLAAGTAAAPGPAQGAEFSQGLELEVLRDGWGSGAPAEVRAVVRAAAGEIWRHCGGQHLRPLIVYHREDFPQTDFLHDLRGRVRIGLASEDGRWAQMVFQFGHEFIHALAQHSAAARRAWRTPRHANLWIEESLCEAGALFALRRLAAAGTPSPPAPACAAFAADRLARREHQLEPGRTFPDWFREHEPALRENHNLRAKNVIVAAQLLTLLEAEPASWEAACFLNLGRRDRTKPRAQYFAEWQAAAPLELRPFIGRVAAVFA